MNRHEKRAAAAKGVPPEHADEHHRLIGDMLAHVADKMRNLAEDWVHDGKDITELTFLIFAKEGGYGMVRAAPRYSFAHELTGVAIDEEIASPELAAQIRRATHEVVAGPLDMLPAVFLLVPVSVVHVAWINPVHSSEIN